MDAALEVRPVGCKNLDDPKGIYGGEEYIATLARQGLATDKPDVYAILSRFTWTADDMQSVMVSIEEGASDEAAAKAWIDAHPDQVNAGSAPNILFFWLCRNIRGYRPGLCPVAVKPSDAASLQSRPVAISRMAFFVMAVHPYIYPFKPPRNAVGYGLPCRITVTFVRSETTGKAGGCKRVVSLHEMEMQMRRRCITRIADFADQSACLYLLPFFYVHRAVTEMRQKSRAAFRTDDDTVPGDPAEIDLPAVGEGTHERIGEKKRVKDILERVHFQDVWASRHGP